MNDRSAISANLTLIRAFALPFGLLGAGLGLGLIIFGWLGISVDTGSWRTMMLILAIASALVGAALVLGGRAATSAALTAALFLAMAPPLAIFSYACAGLGAGVPLMDTRLAAIDAAYGFDWLTTVAWFNQHPTLIWLLGHAYHGTIVPLIYVLVLLNVIGRQDRLIAFMTLFVGSCLISSMLSGLIPAIGAYVHFRPDDAIRGAISADAGVWHLAQFEALRAGTFTQFRLAATEGLVTFPSFHTAAALTILLALRGLGAVTALAWATCVAIIVSTIPIGGHHLIDVIAGAVLTVALHGLIVWTGVGATATPPRTQPDQTGPSQAAPQPSA